MRDPLLLFLTFMCAGWALRRPDIGLVSYVGYSLLGPHSLTWGIAKGFPHVQLISLCTIVGFVISSERKRIPVQRETILMALLWGTFAISTLFAMYPERAIEPFTRICKILLMVFLSLAIINTEQRIHLLLKIIALAIGLHAIRAGLFVLRTGGSSIVYGPEKTFLEANNSFGLALVMNLPLLYYLARVESRVWLRRLMHVMFFMTYPSVIATFSRGSWIGLSVVTALFMLKSQKKALGITLMVGTLFVAPIVLPLLVSQRMAARYETLSNLDEDGAAQSRLWSWEFCKRVGMNRPFTGGGFHLYSLDTYIQYYPEFVARFPGEVWSCHSTWLSIFAEHGPFALVIWIALLYSCYTSLGKVRRYGRQNPEVLNFVHWADMLRMSLIAFAIVGTFVDFAYYEGFYQVVAIVILLKDVIRQREKHLARSTTVGTDHHEAGRFESEPRRPWGERSDEQFDTERESVRL